MTRIARVVISDVPYHVTHRGNHGEPVFFSDSDRRDYLLDLAACARDAAFDLWGYCLMSNHVHLLVVPRATDSLSRGIGRAHLRHTRRINGRRDTSGHLWANRFFSTPLDQSHLWTAIRYIELNPVRAGAVKAATDWPWSSARAHAGMASALHESILDPNRPFGGEHPHPLTGQSIAWKDFLALPLEIEEFNRLRRSTLTGRPCGSETFIEELEARLSRSLTSPLRGRKPKPIS